MISSARNSANQINSQKSTGPRTRTGKARSSQNARRHGLRSSIISNSKWHSDFITLRAALSAHQTPSVMPNTPDTLAHAFVDLRRIMEAKAEHLEDTLERIDAGQGIDVSDLLTTLETFDRYEGCAHYRLNRALEAYAPGRGAAPSRKQTLSTVQRGQGSSRPSHGERSSHRGVSS